MKDNNEQFENFIRDFDIIRMTNNEKNKIEDNLIAFTSGYIPKRSPYYTKMLFFKKTFATALIILLIISVSKPASAKSLPGDLLYNVKIIHEEIESAMISKPEKKVDFEIKRTRTRIQEAVVLAKKNDLNEEKQKKLATDIKKHVKNISEDINNIKKNSPEKALALNSNLKTTLKVNSMALKKAVNDNVLKIKLDTDNINNKKESHSDDEIKKIQDDEINTDTESKNENPDSKTDTEIDTNSEMQNKNIAQNNQIKEIESKNVIDKNYNDSANTGNIILDSISDDLEKTKIINDKIEGEIISDEPNTNKIDNNELDIEKNKENIEITNKENENNSGEIPIDNNGEEVENIDDTINNSDGEKNMTIENQTIIDDSNIELRKESNNDDEKLGISEDIRSEIISLENVLEAEKRLKLLLEELGKTRDESKLNIIKDLIEKKQLGEAYVEIQREIENITEIKLLKELGINEETKTDDNSNTNENDTKNETENIIKEEI